MEKNNLPLPPSESFIFSSTTPQRIDLFLSECMKKYSRTFFKHMINEQRVMVNNKRVSKSSMLLKEGDVVTVIFPVTSSTVVAPINAQHLSIPIIYRNEHFLILNKPAPLLVHQPAIISEHPSVVDWLLSTFNTISSVGYLDRPGIVHRLDKDTSGLLIIALTNYTHMEFTRLFKDRQVHKTYLAVVEGHPEAEGTISYPIGRSMSDRKKMAAFKIEPLGLKLRHATTHYRVIKYFKNSAVLELKPVTGRTHQIRVHCAAIGHPLIGDSLYGHKSKLISRQALHASELSFDFDGHHHQFIAELPFDFIELLNALERE